MTSQPDKPKRWRPRFSVRTLVIVVTLVCCYAACWGPTKNLGVDQVEEHAWANQDDSLFDQALVIVSADSPCPLVVTFDKFNSRGKYRSYYFWFFGYVAKLPYERKL